MIGPADDLLDEVEEFLTGVRRGPEAERMLATVLFTDIVGSTRIAAELGDRRWKALLEEHDAAVRRELARFRGREVDTTGDGFQAIFDGPARAVRCACAVIGAVRPLGLEVRTGLHTGECDVLGEKLSGIAVHIAARVAALAEPCEVLVSSTVKDLVAGSGLRFHERGSQVLRGVPGEWRVFAVDRDSPDS
jgi:class 3 adenylate cyclase